MQHWWQEMRKRNITPDDITLSIMATTPTGEAAVRLNDPLLWDDPDTFKSSRCLASDTTTREGGF